MQTADERADARRTRIVSRERGTVEADAADGLHGRQAVDVAASTCNNTRTRTRRTIASSVVQHAKDTTSISSKWSAKE